MTQTVHVAVGVVENNRGEILISRRSSNQHQGGLWEFPGGKVEPGETVDQALSRELHEEIGIALLASQPLIQVRHDYGDKCVLLDVHKVDDYGGVARGLENQPLQWVSPSRLREYAFPDANEPIIKAIQLPSRLAIADVASLGESLLAGCQRALARGAGLIYLRGDLTALQMNALANSLQQTVAAPFRLAVRIENFDRADNATKQSLGIHLTASQLRGMAQRPAAPGVLLGASCHNFDELNMANRLGVDYALLSPVKPTPTHPDRTALGWSQFSEWVSRVNFPVYALGGLTFADEAMARRAGARGFAAMRAFFEPTASV